MVTYFWSQNGNLLVDETSAYVYDKHNRLTAVNVNGGAGGHYDYTYNGNGDRL